ncbi:hypothetical protein [Nocardioides astragali]|uniref:Type IV toxin-antitoxin system AbiEi family antitoxin domain-containing protein n=1 Tax=Nocardioides astragali TaxID=1776736 RepID=A0ABW2MYA5_9ACTN|nr:hypothetical protein [Nocardioides astragali]
MDAYPISLDDIVLRGELVADGWTDRDIARAVAGGVLAKVRHGAYVDAGLVAPLDPVGWMRVRTRAVLRRAHQTAVASHQSALAEHEVPLWGLSLDETHLLRTDGRAGRREAGVVHHCSEVVDAEWIVRNGIRVTRPARAAIEVVTSESPEAGLIAVCGVLHNGLATIEEIQEAARRATHWGKSLNNRLVLARADHRLSSVLEIRMWHLLHDQRIPRPEPQVEVFDEWGNLLGIVDFLWEEPGVFMETDGRIKYERYRRPGETLEGYLLREKRRQEAICLATGWVCLRLGWSDLERPRQLARRLRTILARQERAG